MTSESLVGGRYRLLARIAQGGMASVWRASDEVLGREVAVKIMHPNLAHDPGFVERFRREAQNAARLNHPGIATVHDWGQDGWMVMELVEGASLRERIAAGPTPAGEVQRIVTEVAAALDHAHRTGIIHRDIKPENVLLTPDGQVRVVDFGVAHAVGAARLTTDTTLGTIGYVAPEQLTGADVTHRTDIYALGLLAYELLTGRPAFEADTPQAAASARLSRTVPSPGAGPKVDGAIAKATAIRPEDRFDSAGEFAEALAGRTEAVTAPVPIVTKHTQRIERVRTGRRWVRIVTMGAALAVLLAAAVVAAPRYLLPKVRVPHATLLDEAQSALRTSGFKIGGIERRFDDAPADTILSMRPASGSMARKGSAVTLIVSKGPDVVDVPSVIGKPLDQALAELEGAGFTVPDPIEEFSSQPKGAIAAQEPTSGKIKRGSPVSVVVSKGPEMITVPDTTNKPFDAKVLAAFEVVRADEFSDTIASGTVIRTSPAPGTKAPKGSKVTVVVSKGAKPFPMPNFVGMSIAAAKARAAELGLVIGESYAVPGSGRPKDQVQGQNPPQGTEVRKGTKIDLYYAK